VPTTPDPAVPRPISNSGPVVILQPAPTYPPSAASRNIKGWVVVEFTVSKSGRVEDPRIVASEPDGIFDKAVLKAVKGWKYKPAMLGGEPVTTHSMQVKLTFDGVVD
jgi:protein TonB